MVRVPSIFLAPISLLLIAANSASSPWTAWEHELSRNCPGRHVELMGDGGYDEFLGAFYDTLTPTEKRVCVLLRLGLTTGDIASVLFTSVRTVESHALNLRRKLHIPGTTRLAKFLANYETKSST